MIVTSFGLKVGDAVHDDVVKEQGFVVDLDVSREQATEVVHVSGGETKQILRRTNQHAFIWMQAQFLWLEWS